MMIVIAIVSVLLIFLILKSILSFTIKTVGLIILITAVAATVWICSMSPEMHKPFSMSTIEYLLKINKDGSMTTTKQVTQTVIKQNGGK